MGLFDTEKKDSIKLLGITFEYHVFKNKKVEMVLLGLAIVGIFVGLFLLATHFQKPTWAYGACGETVIC